MKTLTAAILILALALSGEAAQLPIVELAPKATEIELVA